MLCVVTQPGDDVVDETVGIVFLAAASSPIRTVRRGDVGQPARHPPARGRPEPTPPIGSRDPAASTSMPAERHCPSPMVR
jgi:hypothetical protein